MAFARSVSEKMGSLNFLFFNLLCSSALLMVLQLLKDKKEVFRKIKALPFSYFYKAGTFLVITVVLFYLAVGEAATRESVIVVGIINYLWPGLAFLFAVPILKEPAHKGLLILGVMTAFAGTSVAIMQGYGLSFKDIAAAFSGNILPYLYVFIAAVAWAIYSNITRRLHVKGDGAALPLLFFVCALIALTIQLIKGEIPDLTISGSDWFEFAAIVIFPTSLAYLFWDNGMKRGNKNLLMAVSYAIPLASTLISGFYLQVPIGLGFATAALLVVIGAVLCRFALHTSKS